MYSHTVWSYCSAIEHFNTHSFVDPSPHRKFIARPKGVPPKDGLFRLHASWIYLSYAGFDCLAAILFH